MMLTEIMGDFVQHTLIHSSSIYLIVKYINMRVIV